MEPLSSQTRKSADNLLSLLYFTFVWIPLIYAFILLSLSFSTESLTFSFFYLLGRSTLFGIAQATLSILLISSFVFCLGYLKIFRDLNKISQKIFNFSASFLFSLSPTLAALSLLSLSSFIKVSTGFLWIIFCHFMMNGLFVSYLFLKKIDRFESAQSKDLVSLLKSMGCSRKNFIRFYLFPIFKNDFFSWAPQIFLWCFSSFTPVLLLAESTQQSTPEVLFYYSILNDRSGGRIFFIFVLNLLLGIILNKFLNKPLYLQESSTKNSFNQKNNSSVFSFFIAFVSILFFVPFCVSLFKSIQFFSIDPSLFFSKDLWSPFLVSFSISLLSFSFSFFIGLLCLVSQQKSLLIKYSYIFSPLFILFGWLEVGVHSFNVVTSILIVSFASFLSIFPWFYAQIKNQRDQFPQEWGLYCLSLGMSPFKYLRKVLYPQHKTLLLKISSAASLWAFGEYAFSKVFFERNETLSLFIDENLRRYNFDTSSIGIILSLFGSFILITLLSKGEGAY
jgi:ABC-type Fe3+ transport system permease subunit